MRQDLNKNKKKSKDRNKDKDKNKSIEKDYTYIYGKHVVEEALLNKPQIFKRVLFVQEKINEELKALAFEKNIKSNIINHTQIKDYIAPGVNHQNVIAEVYLDNMFTEYSDFMNNLSLENNPAILVLGELEDPQNVGAIIRSAVAFGVSAVCLPKHNQVSINSTITKVSAGMAFKIPLIEIGNVNNTLRDLKKREFWIYGLKGDSENSIATEKFNRPSVFVLGNEGNGLRLKTEEECDILLSIPIQPNCESLNAATAGAIVLHHWNIQNIK